MALPLPLPLPLPFNFTGFGRGYHRDSVYRCNLYNAGIKILCIMHYVQLVQPNMMSVKKYDMCIVALKNWLKLWIETWRNFGVKQYHLKMKIAPDIGKHLVLQNFLDHRSLSSIDSNIETCCNFITHNQPLTTHNQHRTTYNHP